MDLITEVKNLLMEMGEGTAITSSAYDTAWIARLGSRDENLANRALDWVRANQLPDGSWGSRSPLYYHDRVICTLSAINALAYCGEKQDQIRIQQGLVILEKLWGGLKNDLSGETIAFEMLMPSLMAEANRYNLNFRFETDSLRRERFIWDYKMSKAPSKMINREVTMAHSAEMVGTDFHLLDTENLLEPNGSVGHSPAATAFYLLNGGKDSRALTYLNSAMTPQGAPPVTPIDVFERGWVLWHLGLTGNFLGTSFSDFIQPHLDFLESHWNPEKGIGFASTYAAKDADGTSVIQSVLSQFDVQISIEPVLTYEEAEYFRCFSLEANFSISANIHVLEALLREGMGRQSLSVQKIIRFLSREQNSAGFWRDKWHISPYYTTSHAMIVLADEASPEINGAIQWMLSTQREEGAWGFYMPSAEETAYSVMALAICKSKGYAIPKEAITRGARWLVEHSTPPYPPLWIGKCLYAPIQVIRSAILSALALAESL